MSCGRDRRWSPSWIIVSTTSSRRQPVRQREGVLPRHVGVLRALQDANRAADLDGAAEQQMLAAVLDQRAGDRIGLAIFRRPHPDALGLDLAASPPAEKPFHISSSVKSGAGAISTSPASDARSRCALRQLARQQQRHPAAHRRADRRSAGRRRTASNTARLSSSQRPMVPSAKRAAGFAMAGIVEADAGAALFGGPGVERQRLGALHVGIEAAQPEQPGRGAGARRARRSGAGRHRSPTSMKPVPGRMPPNRSWIVTSFAAVDGA